MQQNTQNILFIGGGNMATALIGGILANQNIKISVLEISPTATQALQQKFQNIQIFNSAENLTNLTNPNFDIVFLAVKPQNLAEALQPLNQQKFWQNALIISIVAGMPTQKIQHFLNDNSKLKIVRVMPNTPALINQAMSGLFANENVDENNKQIAQNLLSSVGKILWLQNEQQIDAITAISGSGPAYVFLFLEALQKAAQNLGFDNKQAELLALQTLLGAGLLAKNNIDSGKDNFAQLREKVTSKGGTTAAALEVFFKNNFENLVENACKAAQQRSIELGK